MRTKEILLLILIVAVGIFFYHAQTGKIFIDWEWNGGIFIGYEEFVYEVTEEISPPLPSSLRIINRHGSVEIQGTDQEFITITLEKRILRRKQKQADHVAEELEMIIQKDSDVIVVSTNRDDFGRRNFRTSFVISLPKYMAVEVENAYGLVSITRAGETNITNPHGEVLAFDIRGPLKVKNSYKDIDVEEVQSECVLEGKNASITVKSVKGGAHIIHRYGKIHLEEMNNKVTVEGSNSAVFGQNINGLMDIQTSYRGVALFDVAAVKIKANSSRIEIEKAKDFLDIKDNYAKLTISNIDGDLYVEGKDLEVYAKYVVGEKIFVSTSYTRVELSKFQGNTEIVHSNGDVFLEPMPLTHPIVVQGRYTDIHFIWPPGGKYPTEARVKGGDIDWECPVALTHQEENDTSTFKAFVDERDEPRILLSTTYGTIKID